MVQMFLTKHLYHLKICLAILTIWLLRNGLQYAISGLKSKDVILPNISQEKIGKRKRLRRCLNGTKYRSNQFPRFSEIEVASA